MAYCTNADVKEEFKQLEYNANTVSSTDVDAWIDQASSLIDSYVSAKYEVPITGTGALEIVKMIAVWLVADRIRDILVLLPGNPKGTQEFVQDYYKKAMDILKDIQKGVVQLPDATPVPSGGAVSGFAQAESFPHQFQRGVDQW